jgi:hypothetical protein
VTLAIILSGIAVFIAGATFFLNLALLGGVSDRYATREDLEEVLDRMRILGDNQAKLFRYLEAVDDRTDGTGHRVLGVWVPGDHTKDAV